jgi:hypothetical protein
MYSRDAQLGDWKSTLKKVRKVVHSIFPRELSPSRMLEKYASDTKKKATAKITNLSSASATANATADAATSSKIATLQLTAGAVNEDQPTFETAAPIKTPEPFDATPYMWLGVFALVGALYVIRSRK